MFLIPAWSLGWASPKTRRHAAQIACPISRRHVHGPRVFKTQFARHVGSLCRKKAGCRLRNELIYGLTPLPFSPGLSVPAGKARG
jgi:hypothetical protein